MKSMRTSFFLILMFCSATLIVSSCTQAPKPIEVVENYGTGETSRTYTTIDGKKEGMMVDYYPDGSLKGERMFKNDIQVGKTTLYHKSGGVREVQYYQNGKVHGGDTIFYEDGKPEMLVTFNEGVKDGYVRKWNKEGVMIYEAKYEMEKLVEVKGQPIQKDSIEIN